MTFWRFSSNISAILIAGFDGGGGTFLGADGGGGTTILEDFFSPPALTVSLFSIEPSVSTVSINISSGLAKASRDSVLLPPLGFWTAEYVFGLFKYI